MKQIFPFLLMLFFSYPLFAKESVFLEYDRGQKGAQREFLSADRCQDVPCVITQWGAIRFSEGMKKSHVELGVLHRGVFRSVAFFQESTTLEQKLSERLLTQKPNRKIVNLEKLLESGETNTLYLYGLLLQYELEEGDILVIRVQNSEYYFRYHYAGTHFDADLAFIQPINFFNPNPGSMIRAAYSTVSLSLSLKRAMDPEKHYSLMGKLSRAVRWNLMLGLLIRKDVVPFNGDNITGESLDGFAGLGVTVFDFLAFGYGANMVRSPHTTFPFVGIEMGHLLHFLHSIKSDTHTRWKKYLEEQEGEVLTLK